MMINILESNKSKSMDKSHSDKGLFEQGIQRKPHWVYNIGQWMHRTKSKRVIPLRESDVV